MTLIHCEVITAERAVFSGDVDMVVAPGIEGQLGVLPDHAPLITALTYGELILHRQGKDDEYIAIGGGFMEVSADRVIILADSAERADEIDEVRAEAATRRAQELMSQQKHEVEDLARAEAALRRSAVRLKVARRRGRRPGHAPGSGQPTR